MKDEHVRFREYLDEASAIVATWEPWERHILSSAECGVDDCPCHEREAQKGEQ